MRANSLSTISDILYISPVMGTALFARSDKNGVDLRDDTVSHRRLVIIFRNNKNGIHDQYFQLVEDCKVSR